MLTGNGQDNDKEDGATPINRLDDMPVITDAPEPGDAPKSLGAVPKATQPSAAPDCMVGEVYRNQILQQALHYIQLCEHNDIQVQRGITPSSSYRDSRLASMPSLQPMTSSHHPPMYVPSQSEHSKYICKNNTTSATEEIGRNSTLVHNRETTRLSDVDAIGQQLSKLQQALEALEEGAERPPVQAQSTVVASNPLVPPNYSWFGQTQQNSRWQPRSIVSPLARVTPSKLPLNTLNTRFINSRVEWLSTAT